MVCGLVLLAGSTGHGAMASTTVGVLVEPGLWRTDHDGMAKVLDERAGVLPDEMAMVGRSGTMERPIRRP